MMLIAEKIEAINILRDEAKRKLRYVQSLGNNENNPVVRAHRKDLAETIKVMEVLRDEVMAKTKADKSHDSAG